MATATDDVLLTAEQFLEIDFGPDKRAELDNGVIRMMTGGTRGHMRIGSNLMRFLGAALRGSGCRPYAEAGVRTHAASVRYPDVMIVCGEDAEEDDALLTFDDPKVIFEILSPSTATRDRGIKLAEYRDVPTVDTIVLIDPVTKRITVAQRTTGEDWADHVLAADEPLKLPSVSLDLPQQEIFARD